MPIQSICYPLLCIALNSQLFVPHRYCKRVSKCVLKVANPYRIEIQPMSAAFSAFKDLITLADMMEQLCIFNGCVEVGLILDFVPSIMMSVLQRWVSKLQR